MNSHFPTFVCQIRLLTHCEIENSRLVQLSARQLNRRVTYFIDIAGWLEFDQWSLSDSTDFGTAVVFLLPIWHANTLRKFGPFVLLSPIAFDVAKRTVTS